MTRSNESWLSDLAGEGARRDAALTELREILLRGLRRALSTNARADDAFLEDVAQDSLLRILDRRSQFAGRSRFSTWATSIAIRVALSELRRRQWRDVSLDELISGDAFRAPPAAAGDSPADDSADREAILTKLYELIRDDLTEKQGTALLAELRGMPQEEIARQLGSNRNAIYKLTHDARKRLKRGFETAGYRAADIYAAFTT